MSDPDADLIQDATAATLSDDHPLADEKPVAKPEGEGDDAPEAEEAAPEPSKADLMEKAQELDIEGRSSMNKEELSEAIAEAEAEESEADKAED